MTTRQPKVHTQLGRAAVQNFAARIFLANDRINQILIEHLDPAAWSTRPPTAKPPGKNPEKTTSAPLRRSSRTCTMSAPSGSGLQLRT